MTDMKPAPRFPTEAEREEDWRGRKAWLIGWHARDLELARAIREGHAPYAPRSVPAGTDHAACLQSAARMRRLLAREASERRFAIERNPVLFERVYRDPARGVVCLVCHERAPEPGGLCATCRAAERDA